MEHEADHRQGDHGFGDLGELLVVPGQAPPPSEPAERPLDHPSPRLHDKAGGACGGADNDQREAKQEAGQHGCEAVVDAVREHNPQPALERLHAREQVPNTIGILKVGRLYDHAQQPSLRVHRDVALAPLQSLGGIPAARTPFSVVLTLWVSMMAAVGLASRPSPSRNMTTRWWRMLSQTPAARNARKQPYTVGQGGTAGGGGRCRPWQPVRTR